MYLLPAFPCQTGFWPTSEFPISFLGESVLWKNGLNGFGGNPGGRLGKWDGGCENLGNGCIARGAIICENADAFFSAAAPSKLNPLGPLLLLNGWLWGNTGWLLLQTFGESFRSLLIGDSLLLILATAEIIWSRIMSFRELGGVLVRVTTTGVEERDLFLFLSLVSLLFACVDVLSSEKSLGLSEPSSSSAFFCKLKSKGVSFFPSITSSLSISSPDLNGTGSCNRRGGDSDGLLDEEDTGVLDRLPLFKFVGCCCGGGCLPLLWNSPFISSIAPCRALTAANSWGPKGRAANGLYIGKEGGNINGENPEPWSVLEFISVSEGLRRLFKCARVLEVSSFELDILGEDWDELLLEWGLLFLGREMWLLLMGNWWWWGMWRFLRPTLALRIRWVKLLGDKLAPPNPPTSRRASIGFL